MITHIVLFKTRKDIDRGNIDYYLEQKFFELQNHIPEIQSMSGGRNRSTEGFDKGFDQGYVLTFKNKEALETYLAAPKHIEFAKKYAPFVVDDVLVFDFHED